MGSVIYSEKFNKRCDSEKKLSFTVNDLIRHVKWCNGISEQSRAVYQAKLNKQIKGYCIHFPLLYVRLNDDIAIREDVRFDNVIVERNI